MWREQIPGDADDVLGGGVELAELGYFVVEVVELPIGHLGLRPAHFDGEHGRAALAYRGVSHITMPVDLQEQAADKPSKRGVPGHTSDVFARSARLPDEAELRRAADRSPAASRTARRSP